VAAGSELASEAYLALVRACPLRPIRDEAGLDRAIEMADTLSDRDDGLADDERDYLMVLCHLIEAYEDVHHRMPADES
jgi:antitoxin component HigA of HigAB toxin-antitoxin module